MAPPPSLLLGTKQQQQRNESPQTDHVVFFFFLHSLQLSTECVSTSYGKERFVDCCLGCSQDRFPFFYRFSSPFCYLMLLQFFFILYRASTGGLLLLVILYCRNTSPQQCTPLCAVTRKTTRTPK